MQRSCGCRECGSSASSSSSKPVGFYSGLCGDKALSADQLEQFREFSKIMHQASVAFFSVSATNLVLTFSEVQRCPLSRLGIEPQLLWGCVS